MADNDKVNRALGIWQVPQTHVPTVQLDDRTKAIIQVAGMLWASPKDIGLSTAMASAKNLVDACIAEAKRSEKVKGESNGKEM